MTDMPFYNSIPFIGKHLKSNALIKELTPTQISKLGEAYQQVVGLGNNPTFASNVFKKLDAQRIEDNTKITGATKGPDGVSILDKTKTTNTSTVEEVAAATAAKDVQAKLATALKPPPNGDYEKAMDKFNKNSATFKELVKKIPYGGFGAQDVISTMKFYVDKARAAIVAQQNIDKQQLTDQFADPNFKQNLMKAYDIASDDAEADTKIASIKDSIVKGLSSAHKKQLSAFDKSTSESLNQLHKAAATEMQKMGLIDTIKKADSDNLAMLEVIAEANRKRLQQNANEPTGITANIDREKATISHADIKDVKQLTSLTGMKIDQPTPGTFVLHFPSINPRYNQSSQQKPLADMLLVAQALKAEGFDKIDWVIRIDDPDTLNERAKQAFEASVKAGIALDQITVTDGSGKELKLGEVYKDDPQALEVLKQTAGAAQQELEGLNAPKEIQSFKNTNVKEAMKEIRAAQLANPPEEDEEEELTEEAESTNTASGPR